MGWQERLWAKVDKASGTWPVRGSGACWMWLGKFSRDGYGRHWRTGEGDRRAHRLTYELVKGPIPGGLDLDHLCRNKWCVNPDHLEPVTLAENNGRKDKLHQTGAYATHCKNGHAWDEPNTAVRYGRRYCRACGRNTTRAYKARMRAA
jgi:hypothetical protein